MFFQKMRPRYRRRRKSFFPLFVAVGILAGGIFAGWKFFSRDDGQMRPTAIAAGKPAEFRLSPGGDFSEIGDLENLFENEAVRARGGAVDLKFFDGSILRLFDGATAEIQKSRAGKNIAKIVVATTGRVAAKIPRKNNPADFFEITTKNFSVKSRGGQFEIFDDAVGVFAGSVEVFVGEKNISLEVGQKVEIIDGHFSEKEMFAAENPFLKKEIVKKDENLTPENPKIPAKKAPKIEILTPGKNDETVKTTEKSLLIRGKVPPETEKVIVNNYTLKQFSPGNAEFSYRASIALGTMKPGENEYRVVALLKNGERATAKITIVFEKAAAEKSAENLKKNSETPTENFGELTIDAPKNGAVLDEPTIVVSGKAPKNAAKIVVNDYSLSLFRPGNEKWSYKMKDEFGNRKLGPQKIVVRAFDQNGKKIAEKSIEITIKKPKTPDFWPTPRGDYLPPVPQNKNEPTI